MNVSQNIGVFSLIAVCLMFTGGVQASYILNTGSGGTATNGLVVSASQFLAGQFTLTDSYIVNRVEGWFGPNSEGKLTAVIYDNREFDGINLELPGSALFSQQFSFDSPSLDDYTWDGAYELNWALDPGTYWLAFEGRPGDRGWGWMPGEAPNPLSRYAIKPNQPSWEPLYGDDLGMRINAVPVPAAALLFASGFLGLIAVARNRESKTV